MVVGCVRFAGRDDLPLLPAKISHRRGFAWHAVCRLLLLCCRDGGTWKYRAVGAREIVLFRHGDGTCALRPRAYLCTCGEVNQSYFWYTRAPPLYLFAVQQPFCIVHGQISMACVNDSA